MSEYRNRKFGLTEYGLGPGLLHESRTRRGAAPPRFEEKKGIKVQLTREEFMQLDRLVEVYRKGRAGVNASRQDLIRYWIAGGRIY